MTEQLQTALGQLRRADRHAAKRALSRFQASKLAEVPEDRAPHLLEIVENELRRVFAAKRRAKR